VIRQNLPGGRGYAFKYWLGRDGQVVGADVQDSAGLIWKVSMSGDAQYTLLPLRNK